MLYGREYLPPMRGNDATLDGLRKRVDDLERALTDWFRSHQSPGAIRITQAAIDASPIGDEEPDTGGFTSLTFSLDLTASGTGKRFYADFSNATTSSRYIFQTSTTNGNTGVFAIPAGTGTAAAWNVSNSSTPDNSAIGQFAVDSTNNVIIRATKAGTGTYGNIDFQTDGTTSRVKIKASTGALEWGIGSNGQVASLKTATTMLTGLSGATATATNLIPAGSLVIGASVRVTTLITGATSFSIGDGTTADLWGNSIAVAAGTTTTMADFTVNGPEYFPAATSVVLTANGGNFSAGAVRVTVHYIDLTAATS